MLSEEEKKLVEKLRHIVRDGLEQEVDSLTVRLTTLQFYLTLIDRLVARCEDLERQRDDAERAICAVREAIQDA